MISNAPNVELPNSGEDPGPVSGSAGSPGLGVACHDGIVVATLDRPEVCNALNSALITSLGACLSAWAVDSRIRGLILTGRGRAFCAGLDVKELAAGTFRIPRDEEESLFDILYRFPKPVVAALNGVAVGGGASLALACDLRIASTKAAFEFNFVHLGLTPEGGSTYTLPRLVGPSTAAWLLFSGQPVAAGEALRLGLVDRLSEDGQLLVEAQTLAVGLTQGSPDATTATKALLRAAADGPYQLQRAAERRHFSALLRQHSGVANEQGGVKLTGRATGTRDGA